MSKSNKKAIDELQSFDFKLEDWQDSSKCNFMYRGVKFSFFWNYYDYLYQIYFEEEIDGRIVNRSFQLRNLEPTEVGTERFCSIFKRAYEKYLDGKRS